MEIIQILLLNVLLILAFPTGLLLAKTTKEELKDGRKAFISLIAISAVVILTALLLKITNENKMLVIYTALFIIIISAISLNKSHKKQKKRE